MTVYRLGEQESYVCGDCEYVGIDVEHGAEPEAVESWDEAMTRFRTRFGDPDDADGVSVEPSDAPDTDDADADDAEADDADNAEADDADDSGNPDDLDGDLEPAVVRVGGDGG